MKTLFTHIEEVRGKPHHVRKQVAFVTAGALAGLIGVVWFATELATGAFALKGTSFADRTGGATVTTSSPTQGLAGAAAALTGTEPAKIEIVDTTVAPAKKPEPTTIPF